MKDTKLSQYLFLSNKIKFHPQYLFHNKLNKPPYRDNIVTLKLANIELFLIFWFTDSNEGSHQTLLTDRYEDMTRGSFPNKD